MFSGPGAEDARAVAAGHSCTGRFSNGQFTLSKRQPVRRRPAAPWRARRVWPMRRRRSARSPSFCHGARSAGGSEDRLL